MSVHFNASGTTIKASTTQNPNPTTFGEWRELNRQYCSPLTRGRRAVTTYMSFKHPDGSSTQFRFTGGFDSEPEIDSGRYYLSICPMIENPETNSNTVLVNAFTPTFSFPEDVPQAELVAVMETMAQHYDKILNDPDACPEISSALLGAIKNPANLDDFVSAESGGSDEDVASQERCWAEWYAYDATGAVSASPKIAEGDPHETPR